jgi:predicted ATPase
MWATSFGCGELIEARAHAEAGLATYDAKLHQAMASNYGNHDASVCARYFVAMSLALEGENERAGAMVETALAVATSLNDPFTLALTLFCSSVAGQVSGDIALAARNAEAGRRVATEHALVMAKAWSTGVHGWCVAESGDRERGLAMVAEAIADLRAMQTRHFMPYLLGLQADACIKAGMFAEAMQALEAGIALTEVTGERFYRAELYRLQGELFAHPSFGNARKAETAFRTAIKIAKQQGAGTLERKARESLRRWLG